MSDKTSGGKIDDDAWYGDAVDRPETLHVGAIHYDIEMDVITTHDRYGRERTICLPVNSSAKTFQEE